MLVQHQHFVFTSVAYNLSFHEKQRSLQRNESLFA